MAYGSVLTDVVQSSTAGTPPQFNDGNGTQTGTLCRAWVNFNGVTTATVRASFNVSSVTRNGTGDYTVNFTNALADANYQVAGQASSVSSNTYTAYEYTSARTSSAYRFITVNTSYLAVDTTYGGIAVFR